MKVQQFTNEVQEFWYNLISSDTIKAIVDFGTKVMDIIGNVVDGLGEIGSAFTIIVAGAGIKKIFNALSGKEGVSLLSLFGEKGTLRSAAGTFLETMNSMQSTGESVFSALTTSSKSFFSTLLGGLSPLGKITLAIAAIGTVATVAYKIYDHFNESLEEMIEKGEKAKQEIESLSDSFKNTEETVSNISERFAELAQGVNMLTGENISLNTEEYEEFLSLSNQLAELFPTLSRNYDENGNAIVQLSGNTDAMVESLNNLVEAERALTNMQIVDQMPDLYKGVAAQSEIYETDITKYKNQIESYKAQIKEITDKLDQEIIDTLLSGSAYTIESDSIDAANEIYYVYRDALEKIGFELSYEQFDEFNEELGHSAFAGYHLSIPAEQLFEYTDNEEALEEKKKQLSSIFSDMASDYEDEVAELYTKIETTQNKNKANWSSLTSSLSSWLSTNQTYMVMSDGMQSVAQSIINSLDFSSLDFSNWDDLATYVEENILDSLVNAENKDEIIEAWNKLFELDIDALPADEYIAKANEYLDTLTNAIGLEDDQKDKFKINLGFDIDTTSEQVAQMRSQLEKVLSDGTENLNTLTLSDLQIATKITAEFDENSINWDDLMTKMDISKYLGDVVTSAQEVLDSLDLSSTDLFGNDTKFTKTVDDYIDKVNELNAALKKYQSGKFSNSDMERLIKDFPILKNQTNNLDVAIKNLLSSFNTSMVSKFASQFGHLNTDSDRFALMKFQDAVLSLGEAVGNTKFSIEIDTEKEKLDNLTTAMQESNSATGLTSESIKNLESMFSSLDSYDPSQLFERTANGIYVNSQELNRLREEYEQTAKTGFKEELQDLKQEYNNTKNELSLLTEGSAEYNAKLSELEGIKTQITELANLAAQYEGLTSAYQNWQNVESAGSERDMYESVLAGKEQIEEEMTRGWLDSGSIAYLEMMTGQSDLATKSYIEQLEAYKQLGEAVNSSGYRVWDFFTTDDNGKSTVDGIYNFFEAVQVAQEELGKEWAKVVQDENGDEKYVIDFGVNGDKAIADAFGISEELVQIILRASKDTGFEVHLNGPYSDLEDIQSKVEETEEKLKELGRDPIDIDVNCNLDEIDDEISNAKDKIKEITEKEVNEGYTDEIKEAELADANAKLDALISRKIGSNQPSFMDIDVSEVDESLQEALTLLKDYQEAANDLETLKLQGADTSEIEAAQEVVDEYAEQIQGLNGDVKTKIGLDTSDSIESIKEKIANDEVVIPGTVEINYSSVNDRLKELGATEYTFNVNSTDIDNLNEQIEEAQKAYDYLKSDECTVAVDDSDLKNTKQLIETLVYKKQSLGEDPPIMRVNVSTDEANSTIENIVLSMQQLSNLVTYDYPIQIATGESTIETQKNIREIVDELNSIDDPDIKAKLGLNEAGFQEAVNNVLATTDLDLEAGAKLDEDSLKVIEETLKTITPEMLVECGLDEDTVKACEEADISVEGEVTWHIDTEAVDTYQPEDKNAKVHYTPDYQGADDLLIGANTGNNGIGITQFGSNNNATSTITATTSGQEDVDELKTSIQDIKNLGDVNVTITATTNGIEDVRTLGDEEDRIEDKNAKATATAEGTEVVQVLADETDRIEDKNTKVTAVTEGTNGVRSLADETDRIEDKNVGINATFEYTPLTSQMVMPDGLTVELHYLGLNKLDELKSENHNIDISAIYHPKDEELANIDPSQYEIEVKANYVGYTKALSDMRASDYDICPDAIFSPVFSNLSNIDESDYNIYPFAEYQVYDEALTKIDPSKYDINTAANYVGNTRALSELIASDYDIDPSAIFHINDDELTKIKSSDYGMEPDAIYQPKDEELTKIDPSKYDIEIDATYVVKDEALTTIDPSQYAVDNIPVTFEYTPLTSQMVMPDGLTVELHYLGLDKIKEFETEYNNINADVIYDAKHDGPDEYEEEEHETDGSLNWENDEEKVDAFILADHIAPGKVLWTNDESQVKKTFTAEGTINWKNTEASGTTGGFSAGTAHSDGTAMSMWNNYCSSIGAYAQGNDWTLPKDESALVNEIGTESIVRDGKWFTIPGGAHVEQLKKGDIIE